MSTQEEGQWDRERAQRHSRSSSISAGLIDAPFARRIVGAVGSLSSGATIVDLGGGPGLLAIELHKLCPQATIIGVDPSEDMLEIARGNAAKAGMSGYDARVGMAEAMPLDAGTVDLVVSQSSFHEWQDQQKGLAEILRVLKPGGSVILRDYNRSWLSGWKKALFGLLHPLDMFRFTLDDLAIMLTATGFSQVTGLGAGMQFIVQAKKPQQGTGT